MRFESIKNDFSGMARFESHKMLSVSIVVICSLIAAFLAEPILSMLLGERFGGGGFANIFSNFSLFNAYRVAFAFVGVLFVLIHFIVDIKVFYNAVFKYRYVIAVTAFFLLVIGQIHFSSIAMFDRHIQPGYGSEFVNPIFGWPRAVRSDEWMVQTPIQLAAQFGHDAFGRYNEIVRGTQTENMLFGMYLGIATFAFPFHIFFLFGAEYGVSAHWVGTLIMTFMVSFELMYIISDKNKLLAVVGACLITFSPFYQWWSFPGFLGPGIGAVVCVYYFIKSETRLRKLLFAIGSATFFSQFVVTLYPAWQVPAGYLFVGFLIWIVIENWEDVKKFGKYELLFIGFALALISLAVGTFIINSGGYITAISNTAFPGARQTYGGGAELGFILNRWANGGVFAPMTAFEGSFVGSNVSEFGGMFSLFPIPILYLSYKMIRTKNVDLLSLIIIIFTIVMGLYIMIGWPLWLANITLMSFSLQTRAMDVTLLAQVFLLVRALSYRHAQRDEQSILKTNQTKVKYILFTLVAGGFLAYVTLHFSVVAFEYSIHQIFYVPALIGITVTIYSIIDYSRTKLIFRTACLFMIILSTVTWMTIHPIMRGLDALYSKPLSYQISELATDTDEKWISLHSVQGSAFLIANGASTISSSNFYPNMELWSLLDPDGVYEEVYNRYAHVSVTLTTEATSFELLVQDHFALHLSYRDLAKIGVTFIHALDPLDDFETVSFTLLYDEGDSRIYRVHNIQNY